MAESNNLTVVETVRLEKFKATTGFIREFNARHNIKFKNLSGEAASVDLNVVSKWFERLQAMIATISHKKIGNIDETGIFWKCSRQKSHVTDAEAIDREMSLQKVVVY